MRRCPWYGLEGCNCDTFPFTKDGNAPEVCRALRAGQPASEPCDPAIQKKRNRKRRETRVRQLLAHVGKPCTYCSIPMTEDGPRGVTRDHVVPRIIYRSRGGPAPANNIVIACSKCNHDKGGKQIVHWLAYLKSAGDRRAPIVEAFVEGKSPPAPAEPACVTDCVSSKDWKPPRWA